MGAVMKPKSSIHRLSLSAHSLRWMVMVFLGSMLAYGQHRGRLPQAPPTTTVPESSEGTPQASPTDLATVSNGKPSSKEYACFLPPVNSVQLATVNAVDLEAPAKTQQEFDDGCAALRNKKWADAEKHLRKAVHQYAKYAAAWVLLGQVLEMQTKIEEASDACSKPLTLSVTYMPAFLCLTDISARQKNWSQVLKFSERALELDPTTNAAAYAYNATANLNLHHLLEAEKSALRALEIDVNNSEPRVHFLLAQIYAAKGDRPSTAAQLREYLKYAKDPGDVAFVKNTLAKLDGASAR